jgi:hypothetical protein
MKPKKNKSKYFYSLSGESNEINLFLRLLIKNPFSFPPSTLIAIDGLLKNRAIILSKHCPLSLFSSRYKQEKYKPSPPPIAN